MSSSLPRRERRCAIQHDARPYPIGMAFGKAIFAEALDLAASLFAQDVEGDDVEAALATQNDGGGDSRCWPVAGTLGLKWRASTSFLRTVMVDCAPESREVTRAVPASRPSKRLMGR